LKIKREAYAHLAALITIIIWGTTFISTKLLLRDFTPAELLFFRFGIGYIALLAAYPKPLKTGDKKLELMLAGAGLSGVTLYFLLENIALTFSYASNVSIILSVAPFFCALAAHIFLKGEKLKAGFLIGFAVAIAGIVLVSFNGSVVLHLNPAGDLLAVLAAAVWAVYSVLMKKIAERGLNTILATRRAFLYGIAFMLPVLLLSDFSLGLGRFLKPVNILNLLYLAVGASALCFVTWNMSMKVLGTVKTSVYIYVAPVITVVASAIVLKERITWMAVAGTALILCGLVLSESRGLGRNRNDT